MDNANEAFYRKQGDLKIMQAAYRNRALSRRDEGHLEKDLALFRREEAVCRELGLRDTLRNCLLDQAFLFEKMGFPNFAAPLRADAASIEAELMHRSEAQRHTET